MTGGKSSFSGMTQILVLLSLLLSGMLYWQWEHRLRLDLEPFPLSGIETASKEHEPGSSIQPFVPLPLRGFREITERPLFVEGRLPPVKPVEDRLVKAPVAPLRLSLEGVVITPLSRVAVIIDLQTKEPLRLAEGMSHSDWTVTKVERDSVTITRGKEETRLSLQSEEDSAASGTPKPKLPFRIPKRRPPPIVPGK